MLASDEAQIDLDDFIYYLLVEKMSEQASAAQLLLYYRVVGDTAVVDRVFHDLQDIDKALK